jgi:hypothetical protein
MVGGGIPKDFYVEQTLCAGCGRLTVRSGLPVVDAMRSGGKEPVLCGTRLVALKERLEQQKKNKKGAQESEDRLDWGSDNRRSL